MYQAGFAVRTGGAVADMREDMESLLCQNADPTTEHLGHQLGVGL